MIFLNKSNLYEIFRALDKISKDLSLTRFERIFGYGNENSGKLLYDRFEKEHNRNIISFYLSLCEIDTNKLFRFIWEYQIGILIEE